LNLDNAARHGTYRDVVGNPSLLAKDNTGF